MTLIYTQRFNDCVKMITDGAVYDDAGNITAISEKVVRAPNLPLVIACAGSARHGDFVERRFLNLCGATVDGTLPHLQRLLSAMEKDVPQDSWGDLRIFVAGWSELAGPFHAVAFARSPREGIAPFKFVCTNDIMMNAQTADWSSLAIKPGEVRPVNFSEFAVPFAELQRATPAVNPDVPGSPPHCAVGGVLNVTTIGRADVCTETLKTWPDKIGALIATDSFRSAGLFLDVTETVARVTIIADQFVVVTSDVNGDSFAPFIIEDDVVYMNEARIRNLKSSNIDADRIDAAEILQDGTLITDLIADHAVVEAPASNDGGNGPTATRTATVNVSVVIGDTVLLFGKGRGSVSSGDAASGTSVTVSVTKSVNGGSATTLDSVTDAVGGGTVAKLNLNPIQADVATFAGINTYSLTVQCNTGDGTSSIQSNHAFLTALRIKK